MGDAGGIKTVAYALIKLELTPLFVRFPLLNCYCLCLSDVFTKLLLRLRLSDVFTDLPLSQVA